MTGPTPLTTDQRQPEMTNDGPMDATARLAVAGAWVAIFGLLTVLVASEVGLGRGAVLAMAITATAALSAHGVVALHHRLENPWRWPAMAMAILGVTTAGNALLVRLGMVQSWSQDLLNLTLISGIALAIRLAWAGYRTRRILEAEVARREAAEAGLTRARTAALRPNGPVAIKVGHGQVMLDPTSVSLLEADGNFARIHTETGEVFASESLKVLAERLAPWGFVRVHKSFVVNRSLLRVRTGEAVELADGRKVPIGRAFRTALD